MFRSSIYVLLEKVCLLRSIVILHLRKNSINVNLDINVLSFQRFERFIVGFLTGTHSNNPI